MISVASGVPLRTPSVNVRVGCIGTTSGGVVTVTVVVYLPSYGEATTTRVTPVPAVVPLPVVPAVVLPLVDAAGTVFVVPALAGAVETPPPVIGCEPGCAPIAAGWGAATVFPVSTEYAVLPGPGDNVTVRPVSVEYAVLGVADGDGRPGAATTWPVSTEYAVAPSGPIIGGILKPGAE